MVALDQRWCSDETILKMRNCWCKGKLGRRPNVNSSLIGSVEK